MLAAPRDASALLRFPRLLLALLVAIGFANALRNGFVWIDHWQVESGGLIAHSWRELWGAFQQPLGAMPGWEGSAPYARPAVVTFFSVVNWLAGPRASAYHAALVLLHLGNVLLAYDVLCALTVSPAIAWVVSAIFAVHPLQTAAVTWISGIADPLFSFFILLALRCELARPATRRARDLLRGAAVASFGIALGAKETAAVFPLLLALAYACMPRASGTSSTPRTVARVAPYLVILAAALLYRMAVLHAGAVGAGFGVTPLAVRLRTVPRLVMSYVTLPLRFTALTVCDDYPLSVAWDGWTIAATLAVFAMLIALTRWWQRFPFVALGTAWMLFTLIPVLNVVPILHYRADRFFYLPLLGWALAAATLADAGRGILQQRRLVSPTASRTVTGIVVTVSIVALIALTVWRNALFADDATLFEATVRVSPLCREARTALGDTYLRAGRASDAVTQYEQALLPQPDRASYVVAPKVCINLGMAQLARANYEAALTAFTEAHHLQPGLLHPLFGLGIANLALGHPQEAVMWLAQAYAKDPNDPDIVLNLAIGYDRLSRSQDALAAYRRYLEIAPSDRARARATARVQALTAAPSP